LGLSLGTLTLPHLGRANTTSTPEKPFRIAHITDVHMMPLIGAAKGFSKCLDHIQSLPHKPDLIINSGDAIMDAHRGGRAIAEKQWRTWNNVIEKELSVPIIQSLGNHDIWVKNESPESIIEGKKYALDEIKELEFLAGEYIKKKDFANAKLCNQYKDALQQVQELWDMNMNTLTAIAIEEQKWTNEMKRLEESIFIQSMSEEIPIHWLLMEENKKTIDELIQNLK
jgi:predicted MPP superfamily phosphohydrolase